MVQYPQLNDLAVRKDFVSISTLGFLVHCLKMWRFAPHPMALAQPLQLSQARVMLQIATRLMAKPCKNVTFCTSLPYKTSKCDGKKKSIHLGMDSTIQIAPHVFDFFKLLYLEVSINITLIFILPWFFYYSILANIDSTFQKILWQT